VLRIDKSTLDVRPAEVALVREASAMDRGLGGLVRMGSPDTAPLYTRMVRCVIHGAAKVFPRLSSPHQTARVPSCG
jgi:hypothetical protein